MENLAIRTSTGNGQSLLLADLNSQSTDRVLKIPVSKIVRKIVPGKPSPIGKFKLETGDQNLIGQTNENSRTLKAIFKLREGNFTIEQPFIALKPGSVNRNGWTDQSES